MKRIMAAAALISCIFATSACETLLGSEEAGRMLPENPPSLSPPYDMLIEGEPALNLITVKGGYYIWKTGNTWHVRVARTDTPNPLFLKDVFVGNISAGGGYLTDLEKRNARFPDDLLLDPHNISFRFDVQGEVKGMDFRVKPVVSDYCIIFDLQINGLATPEFVRLGRTTVIPDATPLRMCFRPAPSPRRDRENGTFRRPL